jgi:hypothetical protein
MLLYLIILGLFFTLVLVISIPNIIICILEKETCAMGRKIKQIIDRKKGKYHNDK